MWHRLLLTVLAVALPGFAAAQSATPRVYSDAGNIFIERDGTKTQLTRSEQDVEPVLSPDANYVVFTRQGRGRTFQGLGQTCTVTPHPDELRRVNVDGSDDQLLLAGRKGEGEQQLCDFKNKQFNSDGRRLYFLTPGWPNSGALHVYDTRSREEHFLLAANDLLVLSFCANKYRDFLVVQSRRYFVFGGSYDWYWLYDPAGRKELGPIGRFSGPDDVAMRAHEEWCRQ